MVVDQASKNVWERERETIQEKVDDLKERPHLDDREFEEFKLLKMALLHIAAIGAEGPEQAKAAVRQVRRAALGGSEKATGGLLRNWNSWVRTVRPLNPSMSMTAL